MNCYKCGRDVPVDAGLAAKIRGPLICPICAFDLRMRDHWLTMARALNSIPERYRGATWNSRVLSDRVPDLAEMTILPQVLLGDRVLLIHGPTGAGKTSFACALARFMVEQTVPDSDSRILSKAQGFRFVVAREIPTAKGEGEGPAPFKVAEKASVLLLDDVGQEATGDGFQAAERCHMVKRILDHRDERELQTIVTTFSTPAEWAARYGAGTARRYWESPDGRVIELGRRT